MIQSERIYSSSNQNAMDTANQQKNDANDDNSDGTWLLITSTMGLTLGYVRIDDHDHELSLQEIRDMIAGKLGSNSEYADGFNFGTEWPLRIVEVKNERNVLAKNVLPSVSVLSTQSARHIMNTNNPLSAATAIQYGLEMNQLSSAAYLQPMSTIFTPMNHSGKLPSSQQYYAAAPSTGTANTVSLLQPQPQPQVPVLGQPQPQADVDGAIKPEKLKDAQLQSAAVDSAVPMSAQSMSAALAEMPSLPPFSPPVPTAQQMDDKAMLQKQKLQNLLPNKNSPKNSETKKNAHNKNSKAATAKVATPVVPRLRAVGADGQVIPSPPITDAQKAQTAALAVDEQSLKDLFCKKCDRKLDSAKSYRVHMRKEHQIKLVRGRNKERRFKCEHAGCNRCFYQSSDLRRHQRVHLKLRPFKCRNCQKEFTQRGSLYRHIKSKHKDDDPATLVVLQTAQTLPTNSKAKSNAVTVAAEAANVADVQMNDANDIPPAVDEAQDAVVMTALPPLLPNSHGDDGNAVNRNDVQIQPQPPQPPQQPNQVDVVVNGPPPLIPMSTNDRVKSVNGQPPSDK